MVGHFIFLHSCECECNKYSDIIYCFSLLMLHSTQQYQQYSQMRQVADSGEDYDIDINYCIIL